ncbi:hypothetical protein G7046_g10088 [Stylonectria norvegica]|nr:hypothetical protein G7046_g10088 [Stylonectria norvegica]
MAPRARRGEVVEPQAFHELGVRGRKTGVFLPDTGERDEHGMQPLEALLSSPQKAPTPRNRRDYDDDRDDSGSEDMDIASSAGPGPQTLLKGRPSLQLPFPRSRSPVKTNLKSPARKNPHLDRLSSPTRGSIVEERDPTVTRKLNFAERPRRQSRGKTNGANGTLHEDEEDDEDEEDEDEDAIMQGQDEEFDDGMDLLEESLQMIDAMQGTSPEPEPEEPFQEEEEEEEEEEIPVVQISPPKRGRGQPKAASKAVAAEEPAEEMLTADEEPEVSEAKPAQRKRGRPAKKDTQPAKKDTQPKPPAAPSRKRRSLRTSLSASEVDNDATEPEEEPEEEESAPPAKRPRTKDPKPSKPESSKPAPAKAAATAAAEPSKPDPKPRGRPGRKAKLPDADDPAETSFAALQRGPPMPKSRGLVSVRHDADEVKQTRSGRHSFRPLDYWRGEQVIREDEELDNMFGHGRFNLPSIKEVIRVPEAAAPTVKRSHAHRGRAKGKPGRPAAVEEAEEPEEWEMYPGTMAGEIVLWEPEHELHPPAEDDPVQIIEEQVALSAEAVRTEDVRDGTFRFAKTLTMPFMGAGVVDLPPGAEKRPKNSRKMHMVFFVHYGKVVVTVNEAQFRISAGGMWFVPRGNYYSITNDYDVASRIFFSQACEVSAQTAAEPDQSQASILGL